jgi:hypothetical protein
MSFLRRLGSFIGVFQRLFGMLVSGLVIFFPVVRGSSSVRVCGEFMKFGSSLVRVIWHSASIPFSPLHLETYTASKLFNCEQSCHRHRRMPDCWHLSQASGHGIPPIEKVGQKARFLWSSLPIFRPSRTVSLRRPWLWRAQGQRRAAASGRERPS